MNYVIQLKWDGLTYFILLRNDSGFIICSSDILNVWWPFSKFGLLFSVGGSPSSEKIMLSTIAVKT